MGFDLDDKNPQEVTEHENIDRTAEDEGKTVPIDGGYVAAAETVPKGYFRSKFFIGTFLAAAMAQLTGVAAFSYIAPVLGVINADIGPNASFTWIAYVYTTGMAVSLPVLGRSSDIFGRRYFFIAGAVLATVGSIVCARAQSIPTLIGGNVLLGVAAGTQLAYNFVLGELVPQKYRYIMVSTLVLGSLASAGFGPAITGSFLFRYPAVGWRGLYYLLTGLNAVTLLLWVCFYFPPNFAHKHGRDSKMVWIKNFDWVGTFLLAAGTTLFLFGLSVGGNVFPWRSAATISMIVLGFVLLCAMIAWVKWQNSDESIFPLHFISRPEWTACVLMVGASASVYYSTAIVWPQQVGVLYSDGNARKASFYNCMPGLGYLSGMYVAGPLAAWLPKQRWQNVASFIVGGSLMASMSTVNLNNKTAMCTLLFLANFTMGWNEINGATNSTIVIRTQQEIGSAYGVGSAMRFAITAVASVAYGTTLRGRLATNIPKYLVPAIVDAGLPESSVPAFLTALQAGTATAFAQVPGISTEIIEAGILGNKYAYIYSFRTVYLISLIFSVLGGIAALFTPNAEKNLNTGVAALLRADKIHPDEKEVGMEESDA